MIFRPACAKCRKTTATIEVIAPHELPAEWSLWEEARREAFTKYRATDSYCLLYEGVESGTGWVGVAIGSGSAENIVKAFSGTPSAELIGSEFYDGAGLCSECGKFYCGHHWSVSTTGYGTCPVGHGKSLDPHWHP